VALGLFAVAIVAYSTLGGFRGSIYTDIFQAVIRIIGTVIAVGAVSAIALSDTQSFWQNIENAGERFFVPFPDGTLVAVAGFVLGYAAAAIGFGLGQPQIVSRFFFGRSPAETGAAWWIYIGFVQFTWISMTVFGILLRGVMPGIEDPEAGLSVFLSKNISAIVTGVIVADVFATIASTSNGILIAVAQAIDRDLLQTKKEDGGESKHAWLLCIFVGVVTLALSVIIPGNVFTIALSAISMIGASLAAPVMIKAMGWKHTAWSLLYAIIGGLAAALAWRMLGWNSTINEAGIGVAVGLLLNWLPARLSREGVPDKSPQQG
jgi:Na+/pantothenate symporter